MPGFPLLAAKLSYQRTAVKGIDMAQSGRGAGHRRLKAAHEPVHAYVSYNFSMGRLGIVNHSLRG